MSELRKAIVEYLAAQDMLHNAHEARLAVGTDWGALHQRHVAASHRLTELLTSPEPDPETAILAAAESLHRERWPNESSAYDPANDPECRPIIEQAVRVALAAAPLPEPVYDFAWLIERGQPEGQVPTVWWWLAAGGREGWTEVATEAFHFESREAAEEIIAAKFTPPTSRGEASARAVEHSFIAAAPLPSEPVGRWEAVKQAPLLSDLRDAICFVERHDHLATSSYCQAGRAQAYRIREALIARYQFAAPSDTPADGLDVEELTDIIEQAIFETDTGLAAAMLAAGRIAALTQEPRSTREEDE